MQWLHFTDFHVGRTTGPFREALNSQVDAVKDFCLNGEPIQAVFLGGDIAYGGNEEEYRVFTDFFLNPLRTIPALQGAKFFAMPGNHDLCCDDALPIQWDHLREKKSVFFCEDDGGVRTRKPLTGAFKEYRNFVAANGLLGPDPELEVCSLHLTDEFPFDLIIANTSFFSNKYDKSSDPITPIPLSSLRERLSSSRPGRPVFIFGHHCPSSFRKEQVGQLATLLRDKHAVYFHGHEHNPDATFHGDSYLKTLGFGAVYTDSLTADPDATYKNTFTFCKVTNRLEIRAITWESKPGAWIETTDIQFNTCMSARNAAGDKIRTANIPLISVASAPTAHPVPVNIARISARPTSLTPVDVPSNETWEKFLMVSETLRRILQQGGHRLSYFPEEGGKTTIILTQGDKRHLLICISAINHIVSSKEVESFNTRLDSEDFTSITVISFGKLSDDARDLYLKLSRNKSIEILINKDITAASEEILSTPQLRAISLMDSATNQVSVLIGESEIFTLVVDTSIPKRSFYIVDREGNTLPPSHELAARLRSGTPQFAKMRYTGDLVDFEDDNSQFDENEYLAGCYRQHNVIKYAGLAAVGLRFSDLPLEELYVNATATEAVPSKSPRLRDVVGDHIAKFPMSEPLKAQLKRELLDSVESAGKEASQARDFCQQFGAVLMVGDPGSGKTCFIKHEILAYCERVMKRDELMYRESWYSNHLPVMIQLSEAASESDFEEVGIFEISARLLARKGMSFPSSKIEEFSKSGKLAWFFDGLDEVVSVERRAVVVDVVNNLVSETTKYGNRVVVTSRPAAIHVVNLLPSLHRLEMQGLSDEDIEILALRILRMRLAESDEGVLIQQEQQAARHESLVAQLLKDCRLNPGVARLAQNPLLLTLLIMVYANSGAPSAKRHIIYEQAIQTLATVRGREAGHTPIAASDIRVRLGAVAISIYKKDSGIIPTLVQVAEVIRKAMEAQRSEPVAIEEAHEFIRKVAEWTGLISIEKRDSNAPENAVVTFMHHSFLEYFGAIGLSLDLHNVDLEELVLLPRWHEILTLLAGIIGEDADVAPVLRRFLKSKNKNLNPDIDAKLLMFAIDCALECEIPCEGAQRLIAESITECVKYGPAQRDPWVRSEIGLRLRQLFEVCGDGLFDTLLATLSCDPNKDIAAAGIALTGYALSQGAVSPELVSAINKACDRKEEVVLCAICEAASRASALHTDDTLKVIKICLKKGKRAKKASLEAICSIPALAVQLWSEIVEFISDEDRNVARLASVVAIKAGLNAEVITLSAARKDILLKALHHSRDYAGDDNFKLPEVKLDTVEKLWSSALLRDRVLALQVLPLTTATEQYVYERLMTIAREHTSREEVVAALSSLRVSEAIRVFKQSDVKIVAACLEAKTVDVRVEAGKLLGCFSENISAVEALLARNLQSLDCLEFRVTVRGLANSNVLVLAVSRRLCDQIAYYLDPKRQLDSDRLAAVLAAMQHMAKTASHEILSALHSRLGNFRVPPELKGNILTCIPAVMIPSHDNIRILKEFIDKNPIGMDSALVQMPCVLAAKCKESIANVEMSVAALSELLPSLFSLYERLARREASGRNEALISKLRTGITELTQLILTFDEFLNVNRTTAGASANGSVRGFVENHL
jgi:hypothetical protein